MTKDGRPSRINDIRYFYSTINLQNQIIPNGYLKGHEDAVAFGRRLVWFLNGEGFSCGAHTALYILLTSEIEPGAVKITDDGGDWWHRYAYIGVPKDFLNINTASELVMTGTVAVLKAIRPDLIEMIEDAEDVVRAHGNDMRFLIKTRQTKHYCIDLSVNIPIWNEPTYLFTSITKNTNILKRHL